MGGGRKELGGGGFLQLLTSVIASSPDSPVEEGKRELGNHGVRMHQTVYFTVKLSVSHLSNAHKQMER